MSVWYAIPSARPWEEALPFIQEWRQRGYKIALMRQPSPGEKTQLAELCDIYVIVDKYIGWPLSVNHLAKSIVARDLDCQWVVTGGDDYLPDMNHLAFDIGAWCGQYFAARKHGAIHAHSRSLHNTFGVMQPTGDRYGAGTKADIETAAASPWMGREWIMRSYQGNGPMHAGYLHFFADTELQEVALKLGVFWQNRHLIQEHRHWTREADRIMPPEHMVTPLSKYTSDESYFNLRKGEGFPGYEPL